MRIQRKISGSLRNLLMPVKDYIDVNGTVDKNTLVERISGEVDYGLLQTVKSLVFMRIYKDKTDELYFV